MRRARSGKAARRLRTAAARAEIRASRDGWDLAGWDDALRVAEEIERPWWSRWATLAT